MKKQITLIIQGRAYMRVLRYDRSPPYIERMHVVPKHRRQGLCSYLLSFAIDYLSVYPELDIKRQSVVAQRIAKRSGYVHVGPSERYFNCDLWIHRKRPASTTYIPLRVISNRVYKSKAGITEVMYLKQTDSL